MSLHINRFIDRIKAAESRQQRDIILSITEARDLHADITKLLLVLQALQEPANTSNADVITVSMDGGTF